MPFAKKSSPKKTIPVHDNTKSSRALPLSGELEAIRVRLAAAGDSGPDGTPEAVTLADVIATLRGRAYTLLLILLALPFITPIPLPGLSTPFGAAIAIIAFRLMLGQRPWLPEWLQKKRLPPGFFGRVFSVTEKVVRFLEKFLRPRPGLLTEQEWLRRAHALLIFASALVLLLPLPVPFSNSFPAWAILLAAGGLLERDSRAIVCAYAVAAAGVVFFVFLGGAVQEGFEALRAWWVNR
ncbi:putative ABC-type transport system, permease component [Opitutaceae bacterium TAV1]|nr:putative ABC-type transport system, permease component [Opitutaceae bacterium TAV1]